ncbi:MAG: hypothetical protein KJ767_03410 [Nanoarchaeota archaeon]|nr:hypothetical protein [Nanoarchaeota archaeon]
MIGTLAEDANVTVYFEEGDLGKVTKGIKEVPFMIYPQNKWVPLEITVSDEANDKIDGIIAEMHKKEGTTDITSFKVVLSPKVYQRFLERKGWSVHQGYRHIYLIDTDDLEYFKRDYLYIKTNYFLFIKDEEALKEFHKTYF